MEIQMSTTHLYDIVLTYILVTVRNLAWGKNNIMILKLIKISMTYLIILF